MTVKSSGGKVIEEGYLVIRSKVRFVWRWMVIVKFIMCEVGGFNDRGKDSFGCGSWESVFLK